MRSLLDEILENSTGPRVIDEQHNLNNIEIGDVRSSLPSDGLAQQIQNLESGNGFFDEAEYGKTRVQRIAELKDAHAKALEFEKTPEGIQKARELAEQLAQDMIRRAIRRANYDTSTGRVALAVALRPAWSKLGVTVDRLMKSAEAIKLGAMDWQVLKIPHYYDFTDKNGNTIRRQASDAFSLARADTGIHLGTVGARYQPIQNENAFEFMDSLLAEHGASYHAVGAIDQGRKVFLCAEFSKYGFSLNGNDTSMPYLVLFNPHDGSGVGELFPSITRTECENTTNTARRDARTMYKFRHTGDIKNKLINARRVIGMAVDSFKEYRIQAETMAKTQMPEPVRYFNNVLDEVLEMTEAKTMTGAQALAKAIARDEDEREALVAKYDGQIERRRTILDDICERYESAKNGKNGMRGTAWAGYNAVTEYANHNTIGRKVGSTDQQASRKFESILAGDRDEIQQVALEKALALSV